METQVSTSLKKVKLTFNRGKKDSIISKFENKIVISNDKSINTGVVYDCEIKPMYSNKGYLLVSAVKVPPIDAVLTFKKGKEADMVSTLNNKIVIAPNKLNIQPYIQYNCGVVLSPNGKAYIVETATEAPPVFIEIKVHQAPIFMVEVYADGTSVPDLTFEAIIDDRTDLENNFLKISQMNIHDKENTINRYEQVCLEVQQEFFNKTYSRNAKKY